MPMITNAARALVAATLLFVAPHLGTAQQTVGIHSGSVVGARDGEAIAYKGIPYAAPPVGDLRWKPPQAAPHWDGVREAKTFGLACPQPPAGPTPIKDWSEDCLTINVWTPAASSGRSMPVLVVIPGGGFIAGGSADSRINGRELAKQGVVVVSFNYRIGVFGFFAHPALSKESPTHVSGNYGLMDQIAALKWVQDNIAAFGGDPRNVTISGSSAGGSSVLYLMVSPLARGLFARGISQSAALIYAPLVHLRERRYGREPAEAQGAQLGDDIKALRALSTADLFARSKTRTDLMYTDGYDYWPIVDGTVLPDEPCVLFDSGRFARTPLIIGTNSDEATVFAFKLPFKTPDAWREHLAKRSKGVEAAVVAAYAAPTDSAIHDAAVHWVNDWWFHGSARAVARAVSAQGVPVFLYGFSRVPPSQPTTRGGFGAFHSAELEYVFGTFAPPWGRADLYVEADRALARAMSGAWLQFTRTGNPNGETLPMWPIYEKSSDRHLDYGAEIRAGSGLHAQALELFDKTFAEMRAVDPRARK